MWCSSSDQRTRPVESSQLQTPKRPIRSASAIRLAYSYTSSAWRSVVCPKLVTALASRGLISASCRSDYSTSPVAPQHARLGCTAHAVTLIAGVPRLRRLLLPARAAAPARLRRGRSARQPDRPAARPHEPVHGHLVGDGRHGAAAVPRLRRAVLARRVRLRGRHPARGGGA